MQVGVRTNARISKQVPGASRRSPGLEDGESLQGVLGAQVSTRADSGQASAHHEDVEVLNSPRGRAHRCSKTGAGLSSINPSMQWQ